MNRKPAFVKVAQRELVRITEKKTTWVISVLLPVIVFLLFALIFRKALIRDIPVAIFDEDKSSLSLLITRYVESTGSMAIVKYVNSLDELKSEFRKGNIDAAFYLPRNMEKNVKGGKQSNPVIFINSMNLIKSNNILNDGEKIIKMVSGGVLLKKIRSTGEMNEQAMDIVNPIKIDTQILFNPNYSYEHYLFPGLAVFSLMMIIMLTSVLLINSEFKNNTFPELLTTAGNKISAIIIGKSIPHIIIHSLNVLILTGIICPLFGIDINGQIIGTVLFTLLFVVVSFFFGFAISCLIKDPMFSTENVLFINTPAFIFSGLTFPLWSMPKIISDFAQIIPFTYFLSGFLKLYQMGAPIKYAFPDLGILILFLLLFLLVSFFTLRYRINLLKERTA